MFDEENVRTGFLEHWEYETLRSGLPPYLVPLFVTGYHVGCRLGELLKLKWEQVDFSASQIWLDKKQTKGKVARVLPVYGEMLMVFETPMRTGMGTGRSANISFTGRGKGSSISAKAWAKACLAAGVPWLRFHDLRRSAVRNTDRAGIARAIIRRIIGHETDAMFDRYLIVDQRDIHEAGNKAEQYLRDQDQHRPNRASDGDSDSPVPKSVTNVENSGGELRGIVTNSVTKLRGMKSIHSGNTGQSRGTEGQVSMGLITQRSKVQILPPQVIHYTGPNQH